MATVSRNKCDVTQTKSARSKAWRRFALVLCGRAAGPWGWEHHISWCRRPRCGQAAAEQVDHEGRQREGASARGGFGELLEDEALARDPDERGLAAQRAGVEVDGGPTQRAGPADANARAEHELHQVGKGEAVRLGVSRTPLE